MCCTMYNKLHNKTIRDAKLEFYKDIAAPLLICGSETWFGKHDIQYIPAAKMKLLQ